jgi:tRNA threonylcarbamoyladenosine biosynthesis protein TsaE
MIITSTSPQDTFDLAFQLGRLIRPPFVCFLKGELGTGKTLFTQALAKGLDIKGHVNSPTFVLMKIYEGTPRLVHVDAYRLEGVDEPIGIVDEIDSNTVMIVEWPQYLNEDIKADMNISIQYIDDQTREIRINSEHQVMESWRAYVATNH